MITVEIDDLKVLHHIGFKAQVDPTPWSMGPINTKPNCEYTKAGGKKKVKVGESESAKEFKDVFSMYAAQHRISDRSRFYKNTPVVVFFVFYMARPLDLPDGPALPLVRPDVTNMQKLAEDTLTGLFWNDDNTTVDVLGSKRYVPTRDVKPYISTDIFYCELKEDVRPGSFSAEQKGQGNMAIVDGHAEENAAKAKKAAEEAANKIPNDEGAKTTTKQPAKKQAAKPQPSAGTGDQSGRVV